MDHRFDATERFAEGAQFIAGSLRGGSSGRTQEVVDPATGGTVYSYELAGTAEVDAAVEAARQAFPEWGGATPGERSDTLHRFAAALAEDADDLAAAESLNCGKPIKLSKEFDVPGSIDNAAFFAGAARHLEGKAADEYSADHTSVIRREPIGVVGSIAPWNYPLQMAAWKVLLYHRRGQHHRPQAGRDHPVHLAAVRPGRAARRSARRGAQHRLRGGPGRR